MRLVEAIRSCRNSSAMRLRKAKVSDKMHRKLLDRSVAVLRLQGFEPVTQYIWRRANTWAHVENSVYVHGAVRGSRSYVISYHEQTKEATA